jgi:hypothetical protein
VFNSKRYRKNADEKSWESFLRFVDKTMWFNLLDFKIKYQEICFKKYLNSQYSLIFT